MFDATVYTQFRVLHSRDGKRWAVLADLSHEQRDRPNAYVELPAPVRTRYVRYEHGHTAGPNLAIGDIRIFGNGDGRPPATPTGLSVRRDADERNAFVTWSPVPGAVGYNVRWGIKPDKLYLTYQVFADRGMTLELRALNVGQEYYVAVEAFDENGVSGVSKPAHVP
jgi:xylan 1,4-beta-xylosidase